MYENFSRVAAESVEAGDICAACGVDDIQVTTFFLCYSCIDITYFLWYHLIILRYILIANTIPNLIRILPCFVLNDYPDW